MHEPFEAEPFYKLALEIAEPALGPQHPLVAEILSGYAAVLRATNRKREAKQCERRAMSIMQAASRDAPKQFTVDVGDLLRHSP